MAGEEVVGKFEVDDIKKRRDISKIIRVYCQKFIMDDRPRSERNFMFEMKYQC